MGRGHKKSKKGGGGGGSRGGCLKTGGGAGTPLPTMNLYYDCKNIEEVKVRSFSDKN